MESVERAGQLLRGAAPRIGQHDAAALAAEQRLAEPFLKYANLIAYRGLGHPQLLGGGGEILMPRGGFEDADGGERRDAAHRQPINPAYRLCRAICWRCSAT